MMTIRCSKCKSKIFKYKKIGKGKIIRCWKDRIKEDYSVKDGLYVRCKCGNLIGIDTGAYIKMRSNGFTYSGTYSTK